MSDTETNPTNFIRQIIDDDQTNAKNEGRVHTRFPPEPNGYLHIGHAKSICLNFGIANDYNGACNLRFDDTNPEKEDVEYTEAIKQDVEWLGFKWNDLYHASDYFESLYQFAEQLIHQGKAYVDSQNAEQIRLQRGTLTAAGTNSRYRDRSVEDNLALFKQMRNGQFKDGEQVLRAKIDMAAANINLRDPVLYRVRHAHHHRTGNDWCIYPMYDYTHCISDALERITHSLCTLEFEDHRPLYDWILDQLDVPTHPQQIEFARLNLEHAIMSKRKLNQLVTDKHVSGWDDPRMPTLSGLKRRGYTPTSIRNFCERIGITKKDGIIEMAVLENSIREDLDHTAARAMAVLNPLKVIITNYPESENELLDAANHPKQESFGQRQLPFGREIYIEQSDFMEDPPKKFFRLGPGREVRLRYAYFITCDEVVKDDDGKIVALHCHYDPETKGGSAPDGRKVKGTIHWVSAQHAIDAEVRLYDRLFNVPNPAAEQDFTDHINPESLTVLKNCKLEPELAALAPGQQVQFERQGYFCADALDHNPENAIFNRTVTLRDTWARVNKC